MSDTEKTKITDFNQKSVSEDSAETNSPVCAQHDKILNKIKHEYGENVIEEYRLRDIKCGFAIDYLASETMRLANSTVQNYATNLKIFVEYLHRNNKKIDQISINDVDRFFAAQSDRNLTHGTLMSYRVAIVQLYKHIEHSLSKETNVGSEEISHVINLNNYAFKTQNSRDSLTNTEIEKILDATENRRNYLIIKFGLIIGCRNIDIRKAKVEDIDFDTGRVTVRNTKRRRKYHRKIGGKFLLDLKHWIHGERAEMTVNDDNPYLFPSTHGGMLTSGDALTRVVKKAAERAGIQEKTKSTFKIRKSTKDALGINRDTIEHNKITAHTLRHTCNRLMQESGIDVRVRSYALDHSDSSTTQEHYDSTQQYDEVLESKFDDLEWL